MIGALSVLGVITARGGSKGVPRKNVRTLHGKPLIGWTIAAGLASRYVDRLVLSTDDTEIMAVAASLGCDVPFKRPAELAADDTPGIAPVLHALDVLQGFDLVVLLQPTSPLRVAGDIDACIEKCAPGGAPACVSVVEPAQSPYWTYSIDGAGRLEPIVPRDALPDRRQDLPPSYALNGAVYVARVEWLRKANTFVAEGTVGYVMPPERSVDIDTERDLLLAEFLLGGTGDASTGSDLPPD